MSRARDAVIGTVRELGWLASHAVSYPLGLAHERSQLADDRVRTDDLSPVVRSLVVSDVEAASTPILLVHGFADNRTVFGPLRRQLRRRGFSRITTHSFSPFTRDLTDAAAALGRRIEEVCRQTGFDRIHVVGHSMGGVLARWYVQKLGGDAQVHTLITLGSPHAGTYAAYALPNRVARQLRPGSAVMAALREPAPGCRTRFVAVWSDLDALVVPARNAQLHHPDLASRNLLVPGVGHMTLPVSRAIVREVVETLAHLDAEGATVTAGVTRLRRGASPA